jgi:predicted MPP superfamily phosphohydrolase
LYCRASGGIWGEIVAFPMPRFLFLDVLLHAYIAARLLPALTGNAPVFVIVLALIVASAALLPFALTARHTRNRARDERLTFAGLVAAGAFSSLLVLTLLRDVVLLAANLLPAAWMPGEALDLLRSASAAAVPLLAAALTSIGLGNARRVPRVKNVDVPIADLPAPLHGFSIVQVSDLHVGPTIRRAQVEAIVDRVNGLNADLIALTGDFVDGSVRELGAHTRPLGKLTARHGAYFVTGNHEYYSGVHAWIAELQGLGMRVLVNEHVNLRHDGARIVVAGVTDFSAGRFVDGHASDPHRALAGAPKDVVRLLLAHQPRSAIEAAQAGADLQLSGHTHGGQFFPWNYVVRFYQPFTAGLHRLGKLWIYVSRGTGYWGPPKRIGAPAEITHLRLVPA